MVTRLLLKLRVGGRSLGRCGCRFGRLVEAELTVDLELDLLTDEHAAAAERDVPDEAPVAAVDATGQGAADLGVAVGIGGGAAVLVVERDLFGDVFDGQV